MTLLAVYIVIGIAVFITEFLFGGWMNCCMRSEPATFTVTTFMLVFLWPVVLKDTVIFEKY